MTMSHVAQKMSHVEMSHVVSKIEPSGISLFRISVDTIFLIGNEPALPWQNRRP